MTEKCSEFQHKWMGSSHSISSFRICFTCGLKQERKWMDID